MSASIKVSKQGKNVLTETNPNSFIFDSNLNTFKILSSGTVFGTISASGTLTYGTVSVSHGQSITPAVWGFFKFSDGYTTLPNEVPFNHDDNYQRYWRLEVDNTNLYIILAGTSSFSGTASYYVFEAPL